MIGNLTKDEIQEWFSSIATKFLLKEINKMKDDSLLLLSGHDSLLSYGRADGEYKAVCSLLLFLGEMKKGGEDIGAG